MLLLAFRNLARRPLRTALTVTALSAAVAVLVCLRGFEQGYERSLRTELDRMGLQLMLVPLGCPYDAAARVLKGRTLENSLPEGALTTARLDPGVAVAAPLLMAVLPRSAEARADIWVGLDETALELKPWWRAAAGKNWFAGKDSVILGCDAAEAEMRAPGDLFFSPETSRKFSVTGVLERSGTSDDSLFFVPLRAAQEMFNQPGRLTAVAIRLRDPTLLREVSERLQRIPGAQVVSLTEMMGVFLHLVGAAHTLSFAIALVAVAISVLTVFNTLLTAVLERSTELSVLRAIGASPFQILVLITTEALLLATLSALLGMVVALGIGHGVEQLVKALVPLAPSGPLLTPTPALLWQGLWVGDLSGVLGGLYPAWRASRLHPAAALKGD